MIGIVGGIGAGKTTASAELAALGCEVIDVDAIGHELLGDERIRQRLSARWGREIFDADGAVDRRRLGELVFDSPEELAALNEIMHPSIRVKLVELIACARAEKSVPAVVLPACGKTPTW